MATSKAKSKLAAILGVAALSLSLTACGGSDNADNGTAKGGSDGPTYIYLTNDPIGVNKFLESGKIGVEKAAEKHGGTAKVYEGNSDQTSIRQNMDQAIAENPDYIVTITYSYTDVGGCGRFPRDF